MDKYIKGACKGMCPEEEIRLRENERLLHILEILPGTEKDRKPKADRHRIVKCFSRSAAGKKLENPKNLRPASVLLQTIHYLLADVISREDVQYSVIYDFITDRLRSVRQDMIIQNLSRGCSITILQPMVRFHAYSAYRLCQENINVFDPHINKTHLQECLKRLLSIYDEYDYIESIAGENRDASSEYMKKNRPQFEAIYLLLNVGDLNVINRVLNITPKWRTSLVNLSLKISLYYSENNFVKVFKKILDLPVLLALTACLNFPEMRKKCFKIMSIAYNSKHLTVPLDFLEDLLLYNTQEEVKDDCKYFGLEIHENSVSFNKNSFIDKPVSKPRHCRFIENKLCKLSIPKILMYNT
nr:unnamed protein product [Callosobruchus chinensis]